MSAVGNYEESKKGLDGHDTFIFGIPGGRLQHVNSFTSIRGDAVS